MFQDKVLEIARYVASKINGMDVRDSWDIHKILCMSMIDIAAEKTNKCPKKLLIVFSAEMMEIFGEREKNKTGA